MKSIFKAFIGCTALALTFSACKEVKDEIPAPITTTVSESAAETEAVTEAETVPTGAETETAAEDHGEDAAEKTANDENVFVGGWHEEIAGRGNMEITDDGDNKYRVLVSWGSSAFESAHWEFTAVLEEETGDLVYEDGDYMLLTVSEEGEESRSDEKKVSGRMHIADGKMEWTDSAYDNTEPSVFVKNGPEAETVSEENLFVGDWHEEKAGRGNMTITDEGDNKYKVLVSWGSSAFEMSSWEFTAVFEEETGDLVYENGDYMVITFSEEGEESRGDEKKVSGRIHIADGKMEWTDSANDDSEPSVFVKNEYYS